MDFGTDDWLNEIKARKMMNKDTINFIGDGDQIKHYDE